MWNHCKPGLIAVLGLALASGAFWAMFQVLNRGLNSEPEAGTFVLTMLGLFGAALFAFLGLMLVVGSLLLPVNGSAQEVSDRTKKGLTGKRGRS